MSFASDAAARAERDVAATQRKYAVSMAKKYQRLERLNDPIIHRYTLHEYLKLHGVSQALITSTIAKVGEKYAHQSA